MRNRFEYLNIHEILYKYWGHKAFRPLQEDIIQSILAGKDTLALLPTGGGKSICFQVPALAMEGLCIVITPLIALMKDQVENLRSKDVPALMINSTMTFKEVDNVLQLAINGKYKFLYVSPERLETKLFLEYLPAMDIALIAVDEAHCISQWGYDFRPPYLRIAALREELRKVPVLAVTASATKVVQEDICEKLLFKQNIIFQKSFERPNLSYSVFEVENKINKTIEILQKVKGTAIVYCKSRKRTKEVSELLKLQHIQADYYNAGLTAEQRSEKQQSWMENKTRVMVCTNAFGMGIDKPDVRVVVHYDVPDCIENYYQEAGRAGRDEQKAYAVLLYQEKDMDALKKNIEIKFPSEEEIKKVYLAISNYLQLTYGSGEGQFFDFDLGDFCKNFKLDANLVINCLKIVEQEEILSYNEAVTTSSMLQFVINKNDLYQFEKDHPELEFLMKTLLRTYQSIFDFTVFISEKNVAFITKTTIDEIKSKLIFLHKRGIVQYKPAKEIPQLYFIKERLHQDNFKINEKNYAARKAAYQLKVDKIIEYIKLHKSCRSNYISAYFNVPENNPCNTCDNCIDTNKSKQKSIAIEKAISFIYNKILKEQIVHTKELQLKEFGNTIDLFTLAVNHLLAEDKIKLQNECLVLKNKTA